ncbi:MAG: OmpA family protein [Gemmatimonadota bacterium]|nr:OmpA family protein [Gemmatimonadota bacterium]
MSEIPVATVAHRQRSSLETRMLFKALTVGSVALVLALPAGAQERGTVEFGAFGSAATFDKNLTLNTGYGGGGRVGMYLDRMWVIEFEDAEMRASRPSGLKDVNVGLLSGRLVAAPVISGGLSLLLGGGAGVSTETNFLHSYGVDALVGAKYAMTDNVSLRVDGVFDWLANENWKTYKSVRLGLSVFRHPATRTITTMQMSAPMMMQHDDSVSAEETRRLRARDMALRMLRDSLANVRPVITPATTAVLQATIHFAFNSSELTDSAKMVLDEKVAVFRSIPDLSIVILGYTDPSGTDAYNMALGERRAEAARAYIVSKGIDANRVILESKGERVQLPTDGPGRAGEAPNRRAIFRLLIAPSVPKP